MLKLKTNIEFDCNTILQFEDVTGFSLDGGVDGGFIPESETVRNNRDFKLSQGVFFHILYSRSIDDKVLEMNIGDNITLLTPELVNPIYNLNVSPEIINLNRDGKIYLERYFIMTKSYYDSLESGWFDPTLPIVYYDEVQMKIRYESDEISLDLTCIKELLTYINPTVQGISIFKYEFFSIRLLETCYKNMLQEKLDKLLGYNDRSNTWGNGCKNCDEDKSSDSLGLIRTALSSIKYLIECENYDDATRILDLLNNCGGLCYKYNIVNKNYGCGCS